MDKTDSEGSIKNNVISFRNKKQEKQDDLVRLSPSQSLVDRVNRLEQEHLYRTGKLADLIIKLDARDKEMEKQIHKLKQKIKDLQTRLASKDDP